MMSTFKIPKRKRPSDDDFTFMNMNDEWRSMTASECLLGNVRNSQSSCPSKKPRIADNKPHSAVRRPSSSVPTSLHVRPELTHKSPSEPIVLSSKEKDKRGAEMFPISRVNDSLLENSMVEKMKELHKHTETSSKTEKSNIDSFDLQQLPSRLIQYPDMPCKGRITVTKDDLACLDNGVYLNDIIVDFYLKYLLEGVGGAVAERSHVFSSFFYKKLSRQRTAGEDANFVSDRHMRHHRVKTWTRNVDIFKKDFLFVPVNQSSHWFLVVVCFPGLEEVQSEVRHRPTGGAERAGENRAVTQTSQQPPECTERGCQKDTVTKRPCFLVMDSLRLSDHEDVCKHLRDYLQVEWEVRKHRPRLFTQATVMNINCRVPRQDNGFDCGLYLLQYVESFLQDPVVHFGSSIDLKSWFPRQRVRQKREKIRRLILKMHRQQKQREHDTQPL